MAATKTSTLPYILHEYSSEFRPRPSQGLPGKSRRPENDNSDPDNVNSSRVKPAGSQSQSPRGNQQSRRKNAPPSSYRESSFVFRRRQERERNERMFEFWESLKEDARDEESDRLQEKISLQQKLIRAQDERHQELEDKRRRNYYKRCQKVKAERDAKNEALQQICRLSLDEDRRAAIQKAKGSKSQSNTLKSSSTSDDQTRNDVDVRGAPVLSPRDSSAHPSLASASIHMPLTGPDGTGHRGDSEKFMALREEAEEEDEDDEAAEDGTSEHDPSGGHYPVDGDEMLPWHHVQLYQLYGKNADYFLHPKIETEQKATIQLNPRLKALGGRAGAGVLWKALRNDSRMRLLRQDTKLLSPELKSAFGAFTREGIMKKRQPVKRNYNAGEDVPDLMRLMDQSKVYNAQDFRHRVELMFRSSMINQDRTNVLMFNNPTPNLNNKDGTESIQRYMPSWADEDSWDRSSDLSYKKWIKQTPEKPSTPSDRDEVDIEEQGSPSPVVPQSTEDWRFILEQGKRRAHTTTPRRKKPNYVFLTEEAAWCAGEFSKRHKESAEGKHVPQAHGDEDPAPETQRSESREVGQESPQQSDQLQVKSGSHLLKDISDEFQSSWEPLSLTALSEYKEGKDALGQGQFNQGKASVWPTAVKA